MLAGSKSFLLLQFHQSGMLIYSGHTHAKGPQRYVCVCVCVCARARVCVCVCTKDDLKAYIYLYSTPFPGPVATKHNRNLAKT